MTRSLHPSTRRRCTRAHCQLARLVVLAVAVAGALSAHAATITVTSTADTSGGPACTLRDALTAANTNTATGGCLAGSGTDTIAFAIPAATDPGCVAATGICTVRPATQLPSVSSLTTIDGFTQPGASPGVRVAGAWPNATALDTQVRIEIDGSLLPGSPSGLVLNANGCTVRGLSIFSLHTALVLNSSDNVVQGSFIGARADGTTTGSLTFGLSTVGSNNAIGGNSAGAGNLFATGGTCIRLNGGDGNTINGNLIGTDATGTLALGGGTGILIQARSGDPAVQNTIQQNVISGNPVAAIILSGADGTNISLNTMGIAVGGAPLPNGAGISIVDTADGPSTGTDIVANALANVAVWDGVLVDDAPAHPGAPSDVHIAGSNAFWNLGGLGVDLSPTGEASHTATPNDPLDADTGPNGLQNHPVISSAGLNGAGGIDLAYTLDSTPNATFAVAAWANPDCSAATAGEARYPSGLSFPTVATDASGHYAGTVTIPAPLPAGWALGAGVTMNATASAAPGSSSEFSPCIVVTASVADTTPDPFAFVDVPNAVPSATYVSAPITVGGMNAPAAISISCSAGATGCAYRVNGGAFQTAAGTVSAGDTVEARVDARASEGSASVTVTIGGVSDSFDVLVPRGTGAAAIIPALSLFGLLGFAAALALAGAFALRFRP